VSLPSDATDTWACTIQVGSDVFGPASPDAPSIDVVHELRAPLTAINAALALLTSGTLDLAGAQAAHLLDVAQANSRRMQRLVDDLLAAPAGLEMLRRQWIDLAGLLECAVAMNQAADGNRGRIRLALQVSSAMIHGDSDRLHQVFANLFSNALKFGPAGGPVDVVLARSRHGFRVSVIDRGPGVPPEFLPCLFRRFARAPQTTAKVPGNGLGLSIARAILRAHGGEISYERAPAPPVWTGADVAGGSGSMFHVDLPAADSSKLHAS
jgi:signal transduction histidine kinase